jgi:heat shock protein HtpX
VPHVLAHQAVALLIGELLHGSTDVTEPVADGRGTDAAPERLTGHAHELAHIKNRDMLLQTVTATMAGAISMLGQMALWFGGRDEEGNSNFLGAMVMFFVAPMAAALIQSAISRQREFKADRVGAEISGKPLALASSLQKLEAYAKRIPMDIAPAAAALAISNPLAGLGGGLTKLFSTHPATEERVAKLQAMA